MEQTDLIVRHIDFLNHGEERTRGEENIQSRKEGIQQPLSKC